MQGINLRQIINSAPLFAVLSHSRFPIERIMNAPRTRHEYLLGTQGKPRTPLATDGLRGFFI